MKGDAFDEAADLPLMRRRAALVDEMTASGKGDAISEEGDLHLKRRRAVDEVWTCINVMIASWGW